MPPPPAELPDAMTSVAATARKPWQAPQVIVAASASGTAKTFGGAVFTEQHTAGSGNYSS